MPQNVEQTRQAMELVVIEAGDVRAVEGLPGQPFMSKVALESAAGNRSGCSTRARKPSSGLPTIRREMEVINGNTLISSNRPRSPGACKQGGV